MNYSSYQKRAEELAKEAGKILQKHSQKTTVKKQKRDILDIVTEADLESERFLIKKLHKYFPDHNIYSEERGDELRRSDFIWVIDPLDGSKEFVRGLPIYNVSLALEYKGEVVVGVVFRPPTNELFSAAKGRGATLNGKKISVSKESELKNSFIWTHLPSYKNSEAEFRFTWPILEKLARNCYRLRPFSEDVASLCWLALGALEGYVLTISGPSWWDVAAGLLMVKEAGGNVTDIYGEKIKDRDLSKGIVASNGKIHESLLKILSQ